MRAQAPVRLGWLAASLVCVVPASAYYHFVHYPAGPPYTPTYEKFDLRALADSTVPYYVSGRGPAALAPGDSFASVVSQIRLAAAAWNEVKTSRLRLAFGGIRNGDGGAGTTPYIDVIFDEIPPGLIALGGPTTRGEWTAGESGGFVPILRSVVVLNRDLSAQRSASEGFFLTLVHEFGHALGLQHTLTSSVMSTSITRATSRARPLAEDDIAGLSILYPTPEFRETTAMISGRVTLAGAGVSLASVVALSPAGVAVSALTNPDGTYLIAGVPPGSYYIYAHPLPPPLYGEVTPANVVLPRSPSGEPIAAGPLFETEFYPGAKSAETARAVVVRAGDILSGIDFAVRRRTSLDLYAVSTYTFPANVAVPQAFLSPLGTRRFLVMSGVGLSTGTAPAPGLTVSVIGGSAVVPPGGVLPYGPDPRYVQLNLEFHPFSGTGPRHLLFALNNDIHVRPSGLHLVSSAPPSIASLAPAAGPQGRSAVAITGQNLRRATRILFDGVPATVVSADGNGALVVEPPAAPGRHRATVVALNEDGQSSWYTHGAESPVYEYGPKEPASFLFSPTGLSAGSEAMVEIVGINTQLRPGHTELGFGSSDISVRGIWVVGSDRLLANVRVSPQALGRPVITLVDGLETVTSPVPFEILPPNGTRITAHAPVFDPLNGREGGYPGGVVAVLVSGLRAGLTPADLNVTVNDQPASIRSLEGGRLAFEVPPATTPGAGILRVRTALSESYPIVFSVRPAPPVILGLRGTGEQPIGPSRPARLGEVLAIQLARLGEPGETIAPDRVTVEVGGARHSVEQITAVAGRSDLREVLFVLGLTAPTGEAVPLTVVFDGRESVPALIPIAK